MIAKATRNLIAVAAIAIVAPVGAVQPAPFSAEAACEDCLSPEASRADLRELFERLEAEHIDLFARVSRDDYAAKIDELIARIEGPISRRDFALMVQEAMAFGRIAHAKTDAPLQQLFAHIGEGGSIIPLSIVYRGEVMITDQWANEADWMPPGSRITHIAGLTLAEFESRIRPLVPADTDLLFRSQVEMALPAYLYHAFGPIDELSVGFVNPDGEPGEATIPAIEFGAMYAMQDARPVPSAARPSSERAYEYLGEGVFYLKPGPFFLNEEERGEDGEAYAIGPFAAFVETAFAALRDSNASDLIIDLRSNPGGDASFSDLIIARLADQPYRHSSFYQVRAGANTKASWADWSGDPDSLGGMVAEAVRTAEIGERIAIDLPMVEPLQDMAFDGRVFVLINKHSYSNAVVVAALMQDQGMAIIMGEETADLPTTYAAVETFTLAESELPITYPKAFMVRPSGSRDIRGVIADFPIAPNPIGEARDIMLETAVTQIRLTR